MSFYAAFPWAPIWQHAVYRVEPELTEFRSLYTSFQVADQRAASHVPTNAQGVAGCE
jgi:hypothetical protein